VAARNPYQPGVGTTPPYLADREGQLQRFRAYLRDFPDKRRNVRLSGLRGVGKTVLLKEYRAEASERDWVLLRRDLTPRLCNEADFALAIADDLESLIRAFSNVAKLKALFSAASRAVGEITVGLPGYSSTKSHVQDSLDAEFFEGRYNDATRADRLTLRVAGSLGAEQFQIAELGAEFKTRNANATQQSVNRLLKSNLIYRVSQGTYAYTAPLFGDFLRRKYPRQDNDR
jgi:hypothetical protein